MNCSLAFYRAASASFLAPIPSNVALVVLAAVLLAATSFGVTSGWAIFGTAIGHQPPRAVRGAATNAKRSAAVLGRSRFESGAQRYGAKKSVNAALNFSGCSIGVA